MKGAKRTIRVVRLGAVYLLLALAAGIFLFSPVARAAPLGLAPMSPDISAGFIDVTYDAGTDLFSASGFSSQFDGNNLDTADGVYTIAATIDGTGALQSGGTLSIGGTYAVLGFTSGTLLTGNLTDLGFPAPGSGDTLEFLFDVTGGDAASLYGPEGGIILSFSGFGGSWESSFNNNFGMPGFGNGVSDNFKVMGTSPIPIPSAVWLLGSAFFGLVGIRRKFGKR